MNKHDDNAPANARGKGAAQAAGGNDMAELKAGANADDQAKADAQLKALLGKPDGGKPAVEVDLKLNIDIDRLTPVQRNKLLDFLASLDANSPAAAIGAGTGKK